MKTTRGRLRELLLGTVAAACTTISVSTALGVDASKQYAGADACRACHPVEYSLQLGSAHARALARSKPPQPGEWAFGAGSQAITFVEHRDRETYLELGKSWYRRLNAFAPTPGHPRGENTAYRTFDPAAGIMRCFGCHSTGPLELAPGDAILPHELGVRCETCHSASAEHVRDPARHVPDNPGRYTADAINRLCGECHRMPAAASDETNLRDPWNMRHQPLMLAASRCYRASNGRLSCLTCHSPHADADRAAAHYDARCLGCHPGVKHMRSVAGTPCADCHMPPVRPQTNLVFANHRIAVYTAGDPLTPRPRRTRTRSP